MGRRTAEAAGGNHSAVHPHKLPLVTCVGLWGAKQRWAGTHQHTHGRHSPKEQRGRFFFYHNAPTPWNANCGKGSRDYQCFKSDRNWKLKKLQIGSLTACSTTYCSPTQHPPHTIHFRWQWGQRWELSFSAFLLFVDLLLVSLLLRKKLF